MTLVKEHDRDETLLVDLFSKGQPAREFIQSRLAEESPTYALCRSRLDTLWFVLVLVGEKRGTGFGVPRNGTETPVDIARRVEDSGLVRVCDHHSIPYTFRGEYESFKEDSTTGAVYVSRNKEVLSTISHPNGGHDAFGNFYGFPTDDIEAFPDDTMYAEELPIYAEKCDRHLHEVSTLALTGYLPRRTIEGIDQAVERGCHYRNVLLYVADKYDIPEIVDAVGFLLERKSWQMQSRLL